MLKLKSLLILFVAFLATVCDAGTIPANDTCIEYTGRIDFNDPTIPTFSYSGVSVRASFTGTSISVMMNDDKGRNYYTVLLDGEMLDILPVYTGKRSYKVAENLEDGLHEIELFKRTEQQFGKTQFYGFELDDGDSLVSLSNKRTRLIEYIGNSITCGYGNEGVLGESFIPETENHYLTYAAINSRNFNARHLAVCKSGIGVYRNYGGPEEGNADCMANYYTRTFLYDEDPKYAFSETPDLVCINLGTNDFSKDSGDSARYVDHYFRLIDTIQAKYDRPDILCLLGPMLTGTGLSKTREYLGFIADSATRKNLGSVSFFEMSQSTGDLGYGVHYHPTVKQHQENARELSDYIKSLKGWKISPLVVHSTIESARQLQIAFNTPMDGTKLRSSDFLIEGDGSQFVISSMDVDSSNQKMIHIRLQERISAGETIKLSYTPGTLESLDSVQSAAINSLPLENNLTTTRIIRTSTSPDGAEVSLVFSKEIDENSSIEGMTLKDARGSIDIHSFSISDKELMLKLDRNILKGDSVLLSYIGSDLFGRDDVLMDSFSNRLVINTSEYTTVSMDFQQKISVYPNPNQTGVFSYNMDESLADGPAKLEIISSSGVLVYKQPLSGAQGMIDLSASQIEGLFFLRLILKDKIITETIVIE